MLLAIEAKGNTESYEWMLLCRMGRSDVPATPEGLPEMKPEDLQHFGKLLQVLNISAYNSAVAVI